MRNFDDQIKELVEINEELLKDIKKYRDERIKDGNGDLVLPEVKVLVDMITKLSASISSIIFKKKDFEYKEDIDFTHPKIQKSYLFLIQAVYESLVDEGYSEDDISDIMNTLSSKLIGFEEKLNRVLKNVSMNMIDRTANPLVRKTIEGK